jgi:hypothetical protein
MALDSDFGRRATVNLTRPFKVEVRSRFITRPVSHGAMPSSSREPGECHSTGRHAGPGKGALNAGARARPELECWQAAAGARFPRRRPPRGPGRELEASCAAWACWWGPASGLWGRKGKSPLGRSVVLPHCAEGLQARSVPHWARRIGAWMAASLTEAIQCPQLNPASQRSLRPPRYATFQVP